jgi:hypothetical protein
MGHVTHSPAHTEVPKTRSCSACGKNFPVVRPWQRQCSNVCRQRAYEKRRRDQRPAPELAKTIASRLPKVAPAEPKVVSPSVPPAYNSQLRPCVLNPEHPDYAALWIPATRILPGRWEPCPVCRAEWSVVERREHRLLNLMLPGEPLWSRQR